MNIHDVPPDQVVAFWEDNSGLIRRADGFLDVVFGTDDKDRQIEILKGHLISKHNALILVREQEDRS